MINYKIVSNSSRKHSAPQRKHVKPGDPDFKEVVLERCLKNLPWRLGDSVTIKGTSKRATIKGYIRDYKQIIWKEGKPRFIIITMDDTGEEYSVHTSQLKPFIRWRRRK
jgi:predicted lysophospholipase L1 biosynthesis ABC-type transport system permease subunit